MIVDDEKLYSASNLIEATEDSKVALNLVLICITMQNLFLSTEKGRKKNMNKMHEPEPSTVTKFFFKSGWD